MILKQNYYIFTSGRLERKDNTVILRTENDEKKIIPIETINSVHVFGEIETNTKLLNLLSQHGIAIHFYNYYGFYTGSFVPRKTNVSGLLTVKQCEHYLDFKKRSYLARSFVLGAIHHMLRNLRNYDRTDSIRKIEEFRKYVESTEIESIQELMGVEADARKEYYSNFESIVSGKMKFEKRTKHPPENALNALISFVNSLVYSSVLTEIYKTSLDPTISFLHEPSTQRFSLALDIAEIFKPLIGDSIIFSSINLSRITLDHFESSEEMWFLNEEGKRRVVEDFREKLKTTVMHRSLKRKVSYQTLITLECYKLIKHFIGEQNYKVLRAWW